MSHAVYTKNVTRSKNLTQIIWHNSVGEKNGVKFERKESSNS